MHAFSTSHPFAFIVGEAEETLEELLKVVDNGGKLGKIKGLVYRDRGEIIVNEESPFIEDLKRP